VAKNFYFENYENSMEQHLIEDLVVESIKIYGVDTWYLPRTLNAKDDILNEDDLSSFDDAYQVEMYVKNVDSFEGEGDFLSKFGLQIRDSITLTIAQRTYNQEVGLNSAINRPREGDLIYLPLNKKYFVVQHVEHEAIFYQMGSLQTYDLRCDLFEYSGERFKTGQSELDNHFDNENIFKDMTGTTFTVEVRGAVFHMKDASDYGDLLDTPKLEARVGEVITFDQSHTSNETHPLRIYTGTSPSNGAPVAASEISVVGTPGNAGAKTVWTPSAIGTWYYIKTTTVGMGDTITISASKDTVSLIDTFADNTVIETLGDNIIDFSQNNPFGEDNF
jgi:hypothetical protein|tara:strand:- start:891 stop:1889 length:999 start_codon:yes stop_codon:yes gene_type:complete